MSVSKLQFLKKILHNFKNFLGSIIPNKELVYSFDIDSQENLIKFTHFVVFKVKPSIDNLDILIDSMMREYKVEVSLTLEQRTKIKRYLECFAEIID